MDITTFFYNKWYKVLNLLILPFPIFVCLRNVNRHPGALVWPWVVGLCLPYLAVIIFLLIRFTIPGLLGKPALILNSEELKDCTSNKTIYWGDIEDISLSELFTLVTFKMKNGKKVRMDVSRFKGVNSDIYNRILSYYKNYDQSIEPNTT
jgi:hypothetical protein